MEKRRPTALTALTVIAIVLGGLVALNGLFQLVNLIFQESVSQLGELALNQPGLSPDAVESQREMQAAVLEVQRSWNPFNWVVMPLSILFGASLLVGGVKALRLEPSGRWMLALVCAFGVFFALLREGAAVIMAIRVKGVMEEHLSAMVPTGDAQVESIMSGVMGASMALSVAFTIAWLVLKVGFYLWGLIALTRGKTRALYEEPPGEPAPAQL